MAVAVSAVGVTLLVLALEGGASWLLSRTPLPLPLDAADRVDVFGFPDVAEELVEVGMVPTPETETTSRYPDNPRGYFRTPDADWDLIMQPSSSGRVVVEDGGVAAYIDRADDPTSWHIQLTRGGISLVGGVEYLLRYRIRASSPREYTVAVSMAHDPWEGLGIYQGAAAGTEWESVLEPFTATVTDDLARFQMDLGGDTADVFVTDLEVTMRDGTPASLENAVDYEWNSRSCRGPDHDADPDPGTFRILALGDSYTSGVGVYFEDVFTSVMQRLLDERASQSDGDQRYEVVNCGVNGFGTREARLFYERRAAAYQPNLVLLVMVANDDRSYAEDITERFVHTPAKWEHLSYAGYYLQAMRFRRPEPDFTDAMLALAELHGAVVDDDAELAVVLFTNTNGREWDLLAERAGTTTDALDVPLLDLREALSAEEPSALMVHPSDGHPNEIAHRIAGETIVEWLDGEGLLRED
jgi:hypothetical protein